MTASTQAPATDERPLWQFDLLDKYQPPSLPASGALADAWHSFRQLFRIPEKQTTGGAAAAPDLDVLTPTQADRVLPLPGPEPQAAALYKALTDWLGNADRDSPAQFVIGQPGSGLERALDILTDRCGAKRVEPPSIRQILAADSSWLDDWPTDSLWVLPDLEACFLRHVQGISVIRNFFDRLTSGKLGEGIIGCDSWAWAYLQMVWPVPLPAITLQPFDASRLYRLLDNLMLPVSRPLNIHHTVTGKPVIAITDSQEQRPWDNTELTSLAAQSRGNPAQALYQWRNRLRTEPDHSGEKTPDQKDSPSNTTLWLSDTPSDPVVPSSAREEHLLVLHTLLLHGGLEAGLLPELLPFTGTHCQWLLARLHQAGLAGPGTDNKWRVSEAGYRPVCQILRGHQFLLDHFQRTG